MISINGVDIEFSNMGFFTTKEAWIHPKRAIDSFEIIFVVKGEFSIFEEDIKYNLAPNSLLLLSPFKRHYGAEKTQGEINFYWLHFKCNNFEKLNLKKCYCNIDNKNFLFLLREIMNAGCVKNNQLCDIKLAELLNKLSNEKKTEIPKIVSEMSEYIRINIEKKLMPADVAEYFDYSLDHCSRLFKKHFGKTIQNFINEEKIKCIKTLLLNTNYSIKEIACLTGFDEENNFLKFFKYHAGFTPTEYRLSNNNIHMNNK